MTSAFPSMLTCLTLAAFDTYLWTNSCWMTFLHPAHLCSTPFLVFLHAAVCEEHLPCKHIIYQCIVWLKCTSMSWDCRVCSIKRCTLQISWQKLFSWCGKIAALVLFHLILSGAICLYCYACFMSSSWFGIWFWLMMDVRVSLSSFHRSSFVKCYFVKNEAVG